MNFILIFLRELCACPAPSAVSSFQNSGLQKISFSKKCPFAILVSIFIEFEASVCYIFLR